MPALIVAAAAPRAIDSPIWIFSPPPAPISWACRSGHYFLIVTIMQASFISFLIALHH